MEANSTDVSSFSCGRASLNSHLIITILLNEIVIPVMALMQLLWKMPLKSSSPMMAKMMMRNMTSNMMLKRGIIAMMIALITICKPEVIWCSWSLITACWIAKNFERFSLGIDERRRRGLKTRNARSDFTLRPCHRKHVNVIKPRFKKEDKKVKKALPRRKHANAMDLKRRKEERPEFAEPQEERRRGWQKDFFYQAD